MHCSDAMKEKFEILGIVGEKPLAAAEQGDEFFVSVRENVLLNHAHRLLHLLDLLLISLSFRDLGGKPAGDRVFPDQLLLALVLLQKPFVVRETHADLPEIAVFPSNSQIRGSTRRQGLFQTCQFGKSSGDDR